MCDPGNSMHFVTTRKGCLGWRSRTPIRYLGTGFGTTQRSVGYQPVAFSPQAAMKLETSLPTPILREEWKTKKP
jgi:hypothetical protein